MECTREQMFMIHTMCWKEFNLLKTNLDKFMEDSERCQKVLNELNSIDGVTNIFGLIVFDRYMSQMVTVLNMVRKCNIQLEINNLNQNVINASSNGCLDDTNIMQTRLLKDFIEWRNSSFDYDYGFPVETSAGAGRIKMNENISERNDVSALGFGKGRIKSLELNKIQRTMNKCDTSEKLNIPNNIEKLLDFLLPTKDLSEFQNGFEFEACVVFIRDYKRLEFFICLSDDYKTLYDLSSNINFRQIPLELLPPDDVFFVLEKASKTEREFLWRAVIVPQDRPDEYKKSIYLIDFGEVVPLTDNCKTYEAPLRYRQIPPLAIKCILEGVEDSSANNFTRDHEKCMQTLQRNEFLKTDFRTVNKKNRVLHVVLLEKSETNNSSPIKNNYQTNPFLQTIGDETDDQNSSKSSDALQLPRSAIYQESPAIKPVLNISSEVGNKIQVIVTHVVSPISFYGIIQNYCGDYKTFSWNDHQILSSQRRMEPPQTNDIVLSQYIKDSYWYRAKVINIDSDKDLYKMKEYQTFQKFRFHWADYLVFVSLTVLSTGIGIYYGCYRKEKVTEEISQEDVESKDGKKIIFGSSKMNEYLLGSRKLEVFPVALSLIGSYVSAVTILGTVSEIYNFGTQYWLIFVSIFLMSIAVIKVYLPVFIALHVGSSYEYLELRFNRTIRSIASIMFVIDEIIFLPVILYVPALSLNQVTDINIHIVSSAMCVFCVIYTLVGGMKAVVHTDAWQVLVMFLSVIIVVIFGIICANGFSAIFKSASEGGRLIYANTNPSLYDRQTLWGVLIGGFFYWTSFNSVNQTMVQRYMSLPSLKEAAWSIFIFTIGLAMFVSVCCFSGLLVYDFYKHCDPLSASLITHDDQLLPAYVMQIVGSLHGIPGLFIAGVFGAALSSLSVILNSTALVVFEDITKGFFKVKLSENASSILVKSCIVVLGFVAVFLVFALEKLSGILGVAISLTAIAAGTTCGLFTLGMLVPWSNSTGALAGAIAGAAITGWISFGTQIAYALGQVGEKKLSVSVEDCPNAGYSSTLLNYTSSTVDESDVFPFYRLSFHWVNPTGVITTVLVGTIVSFLTGPTIVKTLDANVLSPVIHRFLPRECFLPYRTDGAITRENTGQT